MKIEIIDNKAYVDEFAAAELCGVTRQTISNWLGQPNPPPCHPRKRMFPMAELGLWIRTEMIYKRGRGAHYPYMPDLSRYGDLLMPPGFGSRGSDEPAVSKVQAEVELKQKQAKKLDIEIAVMQGELVPARDVELAVAERFSIVKTRLLAIPVTVAPVVMGAKNVHDVQTTIEEAVCDALTELSDGWQSGATGSGVDEDELAE